MIGDPVMAQQFLYSLYGNYLQFGDFTIEFRLIRDKGEVKREYISFNYLYASELPWRMLMQANTDGYNIYFGVASRDAKGKPHRIPAIWLDVDFKMLTDGLLPAADRTILNLLSADCKPSLLVKSGHGVHAYWVLNAPYNVIDADQNYIKGLNTRVARMFEGDNVGDVARILRLPGFYNVKDRGNPIKCTFTNPANGGIITYTTDELEMWLSDVEVPVLGAELEDLIENGNTGQYPSRSEADYACVLGLVKADYDDDAIYAIYDEKPIGEKYREKGPLGADYLSRTIEAARRKLRR
jgi:hypothetical protein